MMRPFFNILLFIALTLTILAASCSRTPQYDKRLMQADSLITAGQAQAAWDLLASIPDESLNRQSDRAFHALLTTQARYKCYDHFVNADEINKAVNYYEHHKGEREKLTRAYIYKGAVMEELGKPDTAMWFYKRGEAIAVKNKDLLNMGYARLRMGRLYNHHHAYDGSDIVKLENALDAFRHTKNTNYQIVCLRELGSLYRSTRPDTAKKMLNEGIQLAQKTEDTVNTILCISNLAHFYFMNSSDKACNDTAYQLLQRIKALGLGKQSLFVHTTFANVYSQKGMPESARYFLNLAGNEIFSNLSQSDSIIYLEALSNIAKADGDSITKLYLDVKCADLTFKVMKDPDILNIMYAENDFDKLMQEQQIKNRYTFYAIIAAIFLGLLALALVFYRRAHRYDKLVIELKDQSQSQMNDLTDLQGNISEMKINDERLKGFISSHMNMMREMIETCYHEPNNRIAENMKRIVKFQDNNRDNWVKLYDYIDMEHNNIMTHTREKYPQLNDRDLLLLALTCMGYSYIQTAIIMGYSNATSVSVIKQRLAKKMELDCSLNEYIEMHGGQKNEP